MRECHHNSVTSATTIREIQGVVAQRFGVTVADLAQTKTGGRGDARARMLVMWLARQCTPYTMPRIGRHFGRRDHKTVANAIQRIDHLMQTDAELARAAAEIREALV